MNGLLGVITGKLQLPAQAWELFGRMQIGLGQKHSLDYFNDIQDHILLPGNGIIN